MTRRCDCRGGHVCAWHDTFIDEADTERDLGDPILERDWDALEKGPLWNWPATL